MRYRYRIITDKAGKAVSFAVAKPDGSALWNMCNFYNGDIRTENRESQLPVLLAAISSQDLPKIMAKKSGVVSIGPEKVTPDLPNEHELSQYLWDLAGLPRLNLKVKSRD
jgi:hypothetical protein